MVLLLFQFGSALLPRRGCAEAEWRRVRATSMVVGKGGTGGGVWFKLLTMFIVSEPASAAVVLEPC